MTQEKIVFANYGYCYSCDSIVKFEATDNWWRDHYKCRNCNSIPRERAVMYCITKYFPDWKNLLIHESSPVFRGTSLRLKSEAENYIASYYFPEAQLGSIYKGYRCENLEDLSFDDNSIDLHITQDVFEHIIHPQRAFKEIARTLRPGGAHFFTTPITRGNLPSIKRIDQNIDGSIEYLVYPPKYHGNPISSEGSLVTMDWGFDITKIIFDACGLFSEIIFIDSIDLGIRAELIEVIITRK